ncbi:MAG: BatA domain-containing protein [Gemmatales bacterium]
MSFLSPAWFTTACIGLGAVAIPVIIHYLFRSRYRVVDWAAMEFLRKSLEEATRRIKFRELLLLLLRMTLLGLLALALMRPSSETRQGNSNTPVDVVFIMDVSGSMSIMEGKSNRLREAQLAALNVLTSLPSQSTVHILKTGKHVIDLGPTSPTNRDQARFILEQLHISHEAAHLVPALKLAADVLSRGSLANKEVYLFSDMQRNDWTTTSSELNSAWSTLQQLGNVILVPTRSNARPSNGTLVQVRPQVALPMPGDRVPFLVEVRNTGASTLNGMTVTLQASDSERDMDTQAVPPLKAGESIALTLTTRLEKRGKNVITAELQGDELPIDNKIQTIVETRDRISILIVDGRPNLNDPAQSASFFLGHAIRSLRGKNLLETSATIEINTVSASEAYPALLADVQICFLAGLGTSSQGKLKNDFAERLVAFVQQGGGCILFSGGTLTEMGLESHVANFLPAKWGNLFTKPSNEPMLLDINSIPTGSFMSSFRHPPLDRLGQCETTQSRTIRELASDALIALRFHGGDPALVLRQLGTGTVMMVGISADLQGTDAALRPTFVPWVQSMIGHVLAYQAGNKNMTAGEAYTWSPDSELSKQRWTLLPPSPGVPVQLGAATMKQDRVQVTTTSTSLAGVYRIVPEGVQAEETGESSVADLFAIAPDALETANLATMTVEELREKFTTAPTILTDDTGTGSQLRSRIQHEWTPLLWWVLLGLCMAELAFGWWCNREV